MGRYAFFITGFEYKFAFGLQPSEDIQKFGGFGTRDKWKWSAQKDSEDCLYKIQILEEFLELPEIDFSKYEKNLDGTHQLYSDISSLDLKTETHYLYRLGAIIYHQLQYCAALTADYES